MKWENQFHAVEQTELLRTTIEIPHSLNALIKSYEPKTGVLQNTISILLTKLSDELRKSNILTADRYAYQRAITECRLELGGGAIAVPPTGHVDTCPTETASRNDTRGASKVARKAKGTSKLSDVPSSCSKSGNNNGKKG